MKPRRLTLFISKHCGRQTEWAFYFHDMNYAEQMEALMLVQTAKARGCFAFEIAA